MCGVSLCRRKVTEKFEVNKGQMFYPLFLNALNHQFLGEFCSRGFEEDYKMILI